MLSTTLPTLLRVLLLCISSTIIVKGQSVVYQKPVAGGIVVGPGNGFTEGLPSDDMVYLTTQGGSLYTIQESTGDVLNTFTPPTGGTCNSLLEWSNDDVPVGVYAVGDTVYMIGTDGALIDDFNIDQGSVTGQPIVKNGIVYVTSNDSENGFISLYDPNQLRVFARLTISGSGLGSLSIGADDTLYVGNSDGFILAVDISDPFDSELNLFGKGINFSEDMRGRPFVTDGDFTLLLQSPGGQLYWWYAPNGGGAYSPDPSFQYALASEGSGLGASVAPILSSNGFAFYVNSGSTTYAYSNGIGFARGQLLWSRSGDIKTKPILDAGDVVYTVERSNGQIIKQDAISGEVLSEFPYTATFGMASGTALLSGGTILTIHDNGILVATCVSLCNGKTASPTASTLAPVVSPTPLPAAPPTDSPVAPTDSPIVQTDSPVAPTNPPVAVTDAPVDPTESPVTPTDSPVAPTTAPVAPTESPVVPTDAPVAPTVAPIVPTGSPVMPTDAPVAPTVAPIDPTGSPVVPTGSPVAPTATPVTISDSPVPVLADTLAPVTATTVAPVAVETTAPVAPTTVGQVVGTPDSGASPTSLLLGIATFAVAIVLL